MAVAGDRQREVAFKIKNTGDDDLRIGPIDTSCGYSSATISRGLVPPGEVAILSARGTAPHLGTRNVKIFLATNAAPAPRQTLEWDLVGCPRPPALLTEVPTVNLGALKAGATLAHPAFAIEILELRAAAPHISKIVGPACAGIITGGLKSERNAPTSDAIIRTYEYQLTGNTPLLPSPIREHLQVYAAGDETSPWITIPIRGVVREKFRAIPAALDFQHAGPRRTLRLIVISSETAQPPIIRAIKHPPGVVITPAAREADRVFLDVTLEDPETLLPDDKITLILSEPETRLEIPIIPAR